METAMIATRRRPLLRLVASLVALVALVAIALATPDAIPQLAHAQDAPEKAPLPPEEALEAAWYREVVEGRFEDAFEDYAKLAALETAPPRVRARAMFRAGICRQKLRQTEEAAEIFRQVLARFPDDAEVAPAARRALAGESEAQAAFRRRVDGLIAQMGEAPIREQKSFGNRSATVESAAFQALRSIGPDAAPMLLAALGNGTYYTTQGAAELLVGFAESDATITPKLITALRKGDDIIRASLVDALGKSGPAWIDTFIALCDDAAPEMRLTAATMLVKNNSAWLTPPRVTAETAGRNQRARDAIARCVRDRDVVVRTGTLAELGARRRFGALDTVAAALDDEAVEVRIAALDVLNGWSPYILQSSQLGPPLDPLLARLDDASPDVVVRALEALKAPRSGSAEHGLALVSSSEKRAAALARLAAILRDPSFPANARRDAVELIASARPEESAALLREALESDEPAILEAAIAPAAALGDRAIVPRLVALAADATNEAVRGAAWDGLTQHFNTPATTEALVDVLPRLGARSRDALDLVDWSAHPDLALKAMAHFDALDVDARLRVLSRLGNVSPGVRLEGGSEIVLKALDDPDPRVRIEAVKTAWWYARPDMVPALERHLRATGNESALGALAAIGTDDAVRVLIGALGEQGKISSRAATDLARLRPPGLVARIAPLLRRESDVANPSHITYLAREVATPDDVEYLAAVLADPAPSSRASLVRLLLDLGGPVPIESIRPWLDDPDASLRRAVVTALGAFGEPSDVPAIVAALDDTGRVGSRTTAVRTAAAEALRARPAAEVLAVDGAVDKLAGLLSVGSKETRLAAVATLGHLRDPRVVPHLVIALRRGDVGVGSESRGSREGDVFLSASGSVAAAAGALLVELGGPEIVAPLLEQLESPNEDPRRPGAASILELVERFATASEVARIGATLERVEARARRWFVRILAGIGGESVGPIIAARLDDEDAAVREDAAKSLGALRLPGTLDALLVALEREPIDHVLEAVSHAAIAFRSTKSLPALLANARDPERAAPVPDATPYAVAALLLLPADVAVPGLRSLALDGAYPIWVRVHSLRALSRIDDPRVRGVVAELMGADDESLRVAAVRELGTFLERDSLAPLVALLGDRSPEVRKAAREAIEALRFYFDQKRLVESTGASGDAGDDAAPRATSAVAELLRLLESDAAAVRLAAASALERLAAPETLAALVRHRKDPDEDVRAAIDRAMEAIAARTR